MVKHRRFSDKSKEDSTQNDEKIELKEEVSSEKSRDVSELEEPLDSILGRTQEIIYVLIGTKVDL